MVHGNGIFNIIIIPKSQNCRGAAAPVTPGDYGPAHMYYFTSYTGAKTYWHPYLINTIEMRSL